jgi:hypothetical protein
VRLGLAIVTALAAVVFWRTAYPTITWWDSSQYSLAASTLGVTAPPGSLLLPLLGWPVSQLPFASPAFALNLLAGALAAITAALVYLGGIQLLRVAGPVFDATRPAERPAVLAGATLGALTFAFSDTLWEHAIKFTPYVLTAVFTGLILWTLLRWWEEADDPGAWRRLMWLGLLFGLDFSVHRTNALLLPAVLAWILFRHPRTLRDARAWMGGAVGMAAGLAVQLLIIPIAASTDSILNIGQPDTWARFWGYVSLEQLGGGFLVRFLPRNAPFWSAQVGDLVRVLGANFAPWNGPLGPLGVLPAAAGAVGLVHLWRRNRRLGTAFSLLLFLHAAATVLYFNIPADFFRPLDRHYLPVCVTAALAVAYGLGVLAHGIARLALGGRRAVPAVGGLLLLLAPVAQLAANWAPHDASRRYFARDFAANVLGGLPPNAVLFTNGDNDTFPLMYLQAAEGVRADVQIVNRPLANASWFVDQLMRRDPAFPISLSVEERRALGPRRWSDTTIVVPVEGTPKRLGLAEGTAVPDSIVLDATPTVGDVVLPVDLLTLDILRTNRWRRPLCFTVTVDEAGMRWLHPYRRLDGLHWRIVPTADPSVDLGTLRRNLLETYTYRGYGDSTVRIDAVSRRMGLLYQTPFLALIRQARERGLDALLHEATTEYVNALPCERLGPEACSNQPEDLMIAP